MSTNNSNDADDRIENMNNNQNNEQNDHSQTEELLYWLQEFYATKILPLNLDTLDEITEEQIKNFHPGYIGGSFYSPFKIYPVKNPGWTLGFDYQKTVYDNQVLISISTLGESNWINLNKQESKLSVGGGPLYLSLVLHNFRCWIEKANHRFTRGNLFDARSNLETNNQLLRWLEEFYYNNIIDEYILDQDFGFTLTIVKIDWFMICTVSNREELDTKDFDEIKIQEIEGQIHCYKLHGLFIIRAHSRGLIKGIQIFKDWVLS